MMSDLGSSGLKSSPYFISALSSKSVPENGDTTLSCMVSGSPKPDVTWYRNGQDISEQKNILNYEMLEDNVTYILHLFRCTEQQAGVYQIVAKNCFGTVKSSAFLKVSSGAKPEVYEKLICTRKNNIETCRANEDATSQWKNSSQVMEDKDLTETKDSIHGSFGSSKPLAPEFNDLSTEQNFGTNFFHLMECGICPPMENQNQNAHCLGDMEIKNVPSPEENDGSVSSTPKTALKLFIFDSIEGSGDTTEGEVDKQVDSKPANKITDHTDSCCFNAEVLATCQITEYAKTHEEDSLSQFLEKGTLYGNDSSEPLENQTYFIYDSCNNVDCNFELHLDRNSDTSDEPFEDDHPEHLECSGVMKEEQNWDEKLKFLLESDDEDVLNLGSDCDGCAYFLSEMPCSVQVSDNTVPMDATIGFCDHQSKSKEVAVRSDLTAYSPSTLQTGMTLTVGQQQTKTSTMKDKEKYKLPVASTAIENDYPRIEENSSNNRSAVDFSVVQLQGIENENLEMDSSLCNLGDSSATTDKRSVDRGFLRKNSPPSTKIREKPSKGKIRVGVASRTKVSKDYSHLLHPRKPHPSEIHTVQMESYLDSAERLHEQGGSISRKAHKDTANASNNQPGLFPGKGRDKNDPGEDKWISGQSEGKELPDENAMLMVREVT
ncbi:hypothetical protein lerEdw1_004156 [Lerista edwardsae]|nr:hypothetical protein lerEdw1_004156 [Lerista edwardsae]